MALQSRSQLRRLRNSFRQGVRDTTRNLHDLGHAVQDGASLKNVRARLRRVPAWLRIARKIYHKYGLKHVLLILVFVLYQFLGALVFLFLEEKAEEDKEIEWKRAMKENQTKLIDSLMRSFFNNTQYLLFLTPEQSAEVYATLNYELGNYTANYQHMNDQKIHWDFWNAMLFAGTVCTTIGYGHLFPRTNSGRLATMVYAIFGIPLVFTILDDLGKLLTLGLKWPWLGCKMLIRRAFRHCTGQTPAEIKRMDDEDKKWLPVFDLPIPVAIGVVVTWIFICSATIRIWEEDWDYFKAFYFFFVSLTTIGLGDIVPSQPKYLLMLFAFIIIGLSLVSMCVNLIQAKLERTYEAGLEEAEADGESGSFGTRRIRSPLPPQTTGTLAAFALNAASRVSLGVLRTGSFSSYSLSSAIQQKSPTRTARRHTSNKVCQTLLSIASPELLVPDDDNDNQSRRHMIPASMSLDDVMKLVDTEETDMYILSQLCGDKEEANLVEKIDNGIHDQDGFMDDDWHTLLLPTTDLDESLTIERRANVQRQSSVCSRVHFRSSISLIPHSNDDDELTSFAGHVISLAHMDSSAISSPDLEMSKNDTQLGEGSSGLVVDQRDSPKKESQADYDRILNIPGPIEPTSSVERKDLYLPVSNNKDKRGRKQPFIASLRHRLSQPLQMANWLQRPKHSGKLSVSNNCGRTSIEEKVHKFPDDEVDDNDRTPLEPCAPKHF